LSGEAGSPIGSVELVPIQGLGEFKPGDDLAELLAEPLAAAGIRESDIVAVTQKIISKAEGRLVEGVDRGPWIEEESVRVLARRGELVIAETRHGFVCANAGVDASNVEPGILSLLPLDPDASAERIRVGLVEHLGLSRLGVVVTDTFGRPWRQGLVNVAIGCAGMPSIVDLRGQVDHNGRELEATMVAVADEVAAASGLVMAKSSRVPVAIVRGVAMDGAEGRARDIVRAPEEDLFRESPLISISARRTIRSFGEGDVPAEMLEEAVAAACTAPAPHHTRPWRFTVLRSSAAKSALLAAMAQTWRRDLTGDGTDEATIAMRISLSDAVLGVAPVLIVPWVTTAGAHTYPDVERSHAETEMFLLSGGAAIQALLLALHAQGLAACWMSTTLFCQEETREVLGMPQGWFALGTVAVGPPPKGEGPKPRPPIDLGEFLDLR
jgi:coenzyme F420-0:L-glutamate ligase / coenzyme F420-1:gamma-L-glutamate ligase